MNILIVDDEEECSAALKGFIDKLPGCAAYTANNGIAGYSLIKENKFQLIFSDVDMPLLNGLELLYLVKSGNFNVPLVLMSGKEDVIKSINAIDLGVYDFMLKPIDIMRVKKIIDEVNKLEKDKKNDDNLTIDKLKELDDRFCIDLNSININYGKGVDFGDIRFFSDPMIRVYRKIQRLHNFKDIPVLIEGKSGVGKEVAARFLHYNGKENNAPFIGLNCATIGKDIFESELFGYSKGAFTGAISEGKDGYIRLANNGTLFLDEITEIPMELQSKLLRVLQENEYYKVGGREKQKVGCRFVFASNKDILRLIREGKFREDLYYRINTCNIRIPSLRYRKEEIIPLTFYFINEFNKKYNKNISKIEVSFLKKIVSRNWKGNIRELKNAITNILLFNENNIITEDMIKIINKRTNKAQSIKDFEIPDKPFDINLLIEDIVRRTLKKFNGNKSQTANFLNLSRIQMYKRFKIEE